MNNRLRDRWLLNLVLLFGLIALFVWLFYQPAPRVPLISDYLPLPPDKIQIKRPGKHPIVFEQSLDTWYMTSPYTQRADKGMLARLLALRSLRILTSYPIQNLPLPALGLQPPKATVIFGEQSIQVGIIQAVDRLRYLQIDDQVILVDEQQWPPLNIASTSYLDRQLIPPGKTLKTLQVNGENKPLTQAMGKQWQQVRASRISLVDSDDQRPVKLVVVIELAAGQSLQYQVIQADLDWLFRQDKLNYHLPSSQVAALGLLVASDNAAISQ